MKVDLAGRIVIEAAQDAKEFFNAALAALDYRREVATIPGTTVQGLGDGQGGVHVPTAERCIARHEADRECFAWLGLRGF